MRFFTTLVVGLCLTVAPAHADAGLVLERPVDGSVVRKFDVGPTPYSPGHRGVDLVAPEGAAVRAAAVGRVHFAGTVAGRPSVSIDHGGVRTTYTPVRPLVREGEAVAEGQVVGTVLSGHCEASCLHWGLTDGEAYFDPLSYLAFRQVRLLPMGARPVARTELPGASVPSIGGQPVQGRVTSPFGMRVHPVTGVYKLHDGTDFGAPCGTPIRTPWSAVVTSTEVSRGYGYRVHVRHDDGLVTAYAHLPRFAVEVGQRLAEGEQLGVVGNTGYSTGCHLHWMAWRDGRLVDPMRL